MGTHPIFESDFDCLTDAKMVEKEETTVKTEEQTTEEIPETKEAEEIPVDDAEEEEEELVDPLDALRIACSKDAESVALQAVLDECTARVESRNMTEETCQQEQFDFIGHRDHCVAHHLFSHLK